MYFVDFQKEHIETINKNIKFVSYILENNWQKALSLLGYKNNDEFKNFQKYYTKKKSFLDKLNNLKNKKEFTKKEIQLISYLCDSCCRFELAQIGEIIIFLNINTMPMDKREYSLIGHPSVTKIKMELFKLSSNSYIGIYGHNSLNCQLNCEIHQKIRNFLSWEDFPEGGITVNFDEPDSLTNVKLPIICKIS